MITFKDKTELMYNWLNKLQRKIKSLPLEESAIIKRCAGEFMLQHKRDYIDSFDLYAMSQVFSATERVFRKSKFTGKPSPKYLNSTSIAVEMLS